MGLYKVLPDTVTDVDVIIAGGLWQFTQSLFSPVTDP